MPAIIASNVNFETDRYYIDLGELANVFPHIREGKNAKLYLIELRNESNKLVKRFKPFKELKLKISTYWDAPTNQWMPCLDLPEHVVSQFNLGINYRVIFVLIAYDNRPFLPFELKCFGYDSEKALECVSKIEASLLSFSLEQPIINKVVSYLWDAYSRLEENDIEGARTSIRNSLDVLQNELVPKINVIEEPEVFPQRLRSLIKGLEGFVHYGGPHPGPAPKTTTNMVISITTELVRSLAQALESKVISLKEGS